MQKHVMVARFSNDGGKTNVGYMLIGAGFNISVMKAEDVTRLAAQNAIENMEVENGELKSTNGALKRYTCIDSTTQRFIGNCRAVILSRIEDGDGNLKGYQIFGANNVVQKIDISKAVQMAQNDMIVNGKLRNTSRGLIVASIGGEYPVWQMKEKSEAVNKEREVNIVMFRSALSNSGELVKSASIVVSYKNALEMKNDFVKLKESNDKLASQLKSLGYKGDDTLEIRACGNSIACEVRYIDFLTLTKGNGVKVTSSYAEGDTVICCRDLAGNESAIRLGEKNEILSKGTAETNNNVKRYAAVIKKEHLVK